MCLLESLSVLFEINRVEFEGDHLHFVSLLQLKKLSPWEPFSLEGGCAFSEVAEEDFLPCLYSQLGVAEAQKFIIVIGHWIFCILFHVEYFLGCQAEEEAISRFLGAFLLIGEFGDSSDDGSSFQVGEYHQIWNVIKIQMEVVGVQGIVFEGESSFVG